MLNFKEKMLVFSLSLAVVASFVYWGRAIYLGLTYPVAKFGGEYAEGIAGHPLYVNPLLSMSSEADSDLVALIYSGLFKYDGSGKIVNDIAEDYDISNENKTYEVRLKQGIKWHDGLDLNADDVIFTFNLIKDPSYKSPLRRNWQGIEVSKIDDYTVRFDLKNPYFGFLENLTVGILPKHVWQDITADRFSLSELNLKPIGSGPYMFVDLQKDSNGDIVTYRLSAFKQYHEGSPYIAKIRLNFYPSEDMLLADFNNKEVSGMNIISPENISSMKSSKNVEVKEIVIPRYFALFINQSKSVALSYDKVRKALAMSVNRKEMLERALAGKGFELYSPILPESDGFTDFSSDYAYNPEEAKKMLDEDGWKMDENEGVRKKGDDKLEFEVITTDWPQIVESAEALKEQWAQIGVKMDVKLVEAADLQQNYIKTREYQGILIGQELKFDPDLYSYFHSENKRDPGANLSLFDNKDVDELSSSVRQELNGEKRAESNKKIAEIIKEKNPAIFLYGSYYLYPMSKNVKGMEVKNIVSPSQRFSEINKWYIKTSRIWK